MLNQTQIKTETDKCLGCKNASCERNCPLHLSAKKFIQLYKDEKYFDLINYMYSVNPFAEICGYICPNKFCMNNCNRKFIDNSINIKSLQQSFSNKYKYLINYNKIQSNDKKIAIVGSGVAGLTAAWYLANKGYLVDVYEKTNKIGGELNLIPEFRLPKSVLESDLSLIKNNPNIHFYLNKEIEDFDILSHYNGIITAIGKQNNRLLNIAGEEYIISYNDYLTKQPKTNKIAIIGGGNVALDCALLAKSLGSEVFMFVRRNLYDMRIEHNDILNLIDKKVNIITNFTPIRITKNLTIEGQYSSTNINFAGFDLVVRAIGSYQKEVNNELVLKLPISNTVVETIANTLTALKEFNL